MCLGESEILIRLVFGYFLGTFRLIQNLDLYLVNI